MLICAADICQRGINRRETNKNGVRYMHRCLRLDGKEITTPFAMLKIGDLQKAKVTFNAEYNGPLHFPWIKEMIKRSRKCSSSHDPEDEPASSKGNLTKLFSNQNLT